MNVTERISAEIDEKTQKRPENYQLIREKDGIFVYRCVYDGKPAVAKYFGREADRREIANYRLMKRADVPTIKTYALCESCILMEDIDASDEWRLGVEADMSDPDVLRALAGWYYRLHQGGRHVATQRLYSENDDLNRETLAFLREKLPEAVELLDYVGERMEFFRGFIGEREDTIVYNDFYYTNLIVKRDKSEAMMFDYNFMGRGYRYADFRNVQSSVTAEAFAAFMEAYEECHWAENEEGFAVDETDRRLDEFLSPLLGLANAFRREKFPAWAEEMREEAVNGALLARAKEIVEAEERRAFKRELYVYAPYNEQEEADVREMIRVISNEKENGQTTHLLPCLTDCGREIFTRDSRTMHMTASAWVVSPDRKHVLMAYHNLYKSWAWLGGHADGEANLMEVARREVMEESGVKNVRPLVNTIFSVEILTVDGHVKKGKYVPSHLHLNVTYLFEADMEEALAVNEDENSAVAWIPVEEVAGKVSEPWMMERIYSKLIEKAARLGRMKKVTLSHDGPLTIYAVPDAAAEHLREYCMAFCRWLGESPDAEKYRDERGGICYGEDAFIRYLNEVVFPDEPSFAVCRLGWGERGQEEYGELPHFNF